MIVKITPIIPIADNKNEIDNSIIFFQYVKGFPEVLIHNTIGFR